MKSKLSISLICGMLALSAAPSLSAGITLQNGTFIDTKSKPSMPLSDHYSRGLRALEAQDWDEASKNFYIVASNSPNTQIGQDSNYFLGVAYYHQAEYDLANDSFTQYLKAKSHPKYFLETIQYKFEIAEKFSNGEKRRFFGSKRFPKLAPGRSEALRIYEEVVAAMPSHPLAAQALYAKGLLHWKNREYKDAIDAYQMVTKRFPKHELSPESYLAISKVYIDQSLSEYQNPDILAFAQINLRRFKQDFPKEERIAQIEKDVRTIEEIHAKGIYSTAQFYERKGQPNAAAIYYRSAIKQFPDTPSARLSRNRLAAIDPAFSTQEDAKEQ